MRENPVFSRVLKKSVKGKAVEKFRRKIVDPYCKNNKVLRNIEIYDFVIFRDGSYYSLFS